MRVIYESEQPEFWQEFLVGETGQGGRGLAGFTGYQYQRGRGLGSFFRGLFRMAVPVLKKAAKAIGKEALKTGVGVLADVSRGVDPLQSLEVHGREAVATLAEKAQQHIKEQTGGRKRKATPKRKKVNKRKTAPKRKKVNKRKSSAKKIKLDIFQ